MALVVGVALLAKVVVLVLVPVAKVVVLVRSSAQNQLALELALIQPK